MPLALGEYLHHGQAIELRHSIGGAIPAIQITGSPAAARNPQHRHCGSALFEYRTQRLMLSSSREEQVSCTRAEPGCIASRAQVAADPAQAP